MSVETLHNDCTSEQIEEWHALHDRIASLDAARRDAQREAGAWLTWALERPEEVMPYAQEQALAEAQRAVDLWAERVQLAEVVAAHPYTAVVQAMIEKRRR